MHRIPFTALLASATLVAPMLASADTATFYFDQNTVYRSTANIPIGFYAGGSPTFLENFEDGSLDGQLSGSGGSIIGPGQFGGSRDGVDADDGVIDNVCGPQASKCHDWFTGTGTTGVTFTFTGSQLPTAFGLVWTDGGFNTTVTFTAFDADGHSLGSIVRSGFADGSNAGTTIDDRFFGVTFSGGIKSIKIQHTLGGLEVDHVQYGNMVSAVPEPGTAALWLAGLAVFGRLAHRRGRPR